MIICFLTEKRKRERKEGEVFNSNAIINLDDYAIPVSPPKLSSTASKFMYPYTLSSYRKDINPLTAIYEELQHALSKKKKDNFDRWLIDLVVDIREDIIAALESDIVAIRKYLDKVGKYHDYQLHLLHNRFKNYLEFFKTYFTG